MKKLLSLFVLLASAASAQADFVVDGFTYHQLGENTVALSVAPEDALGDVFIPATVEYDGVTYTVTRIYDTVFRERYDLTSVTFADDSAVEIIDEYAFHNCSALRYISLPNSLKSIEPYTFEFAGNDVEDFYVSLGNGVTSIGERAFTNCVWLTRVSIPRGVTHIDKGAFDNCRRLTEVVIPDGVTLTVTGGVKLEENQEENHKLSIYGQSGNASGTLIATNSYENGAGIGGGGEGLKAGALVVHGGIIQAKGNLDGAGIGGGYKAGFGTTALSGLTVYGGSVTAEGDKAGAGIGSGAKCQDFAGYVTIYGGTVTATGGGTQEIQEQANSSWSGAGIGGGDSSKGAIVHIYGGTVTATSGGANDNYRRAAGIGGGFKSSGEQTNIHGGIVTAISTYGAGIGGGYGDDANGGYITIEGGAVNATSYYGAGIGTGCESEWANIIITGGNVSATSTEGAGIGGGRSADATAQISISGGTVVATGTTAIGSGGSHEGELLSFKGTINISGGKVYATGNNDRRPKECRALGGANYEVCAASTTLPDNAMVKAGASAEEAELFTANLRLTACLTKYYAAIEPCTHSEAGIYIDNGTTHHTTCPYCLTSEADLTEAHTFNSDGECKCGLLGLNDAADNAAILAKWNEWARPVALSGRTLYKDGAWNTLCLPFDVTTSNIIYSPLNDATSYMVLDTEGYYDNDNQPSDSGTNQTGLVGSTLYLYFKTPVADSEGIVIPAGTPFIVNWAGDGTNNLVNPVFSGVTISATGPTTVVSTDEKVSFKGNYNPVSVEASESILFMGGDNTLYYPHAARTINAFRAWFDLGSNKAREFRLSFGKEGEASSINEELRMKNEEFATAAGWYTLDGRKLDGKPAKKGLYIYNGRKVAIK